MPTTYPGLVPPISNLVPTEPHLQQVVVANVIDQLNNFSPFANFLKANINDEDLHRIYNTNLLHRTHFQGIVRLPASPFIVVAGGDKLNKEACLFVFEIKSVFKNNRNEAHDFGSNIIKRLARIPKDDLFIETISIKSGDYWHIGGISGYGNIILAPMESSDIKTSFIEFYDFTNPIQPVHYEHLQISRGEAFGRVGCCAMCRLPNNFYLLAAWRDKGKTGMFDLYISKTTDLNDGFHQQRDEVRSITFKDFKYKGAENPQYQSIQFIIQDDGKIFLTGFLGFAPYPAVSGSGSNKIDAYEVILPQNEDASVPFVEQLIIEHVSTIEIAKSSKQYNFEAATSLYNVDGRLALYSSFYWIESKEFKFAEFCQTMKAGNTQLFREGVIELFQHKNFKGRCLRLYGDKVNLKDMVNISAQGLDFTKDISSLKFLLPTGVNLLLTDDDGNERIFQGQTGVLKLLPDLSNFGDEVEGVDVG